MFIKIDKLVGFSLFSIPKKGKAVFSIKFPSNILGFLKRNCAFLYFGHGSETIRFNCNRAVRSETSRFLAHNKNTILCGKEAKRLAWTAIGRYEAKHLASSVIIKISQSRKNKKNK